MGSSSSGLSRATWPPPNRPSRPWWRRHGPMVLGVCRRILGNPQDAADAFQATFLVLLRRAASLRIEGSLGGWLHEVSRRIAMQARSSAAQRAAREVCVPQLEAVEAPAHDPDRGELLAILDEEIARLPEKFRTAVVLCELEGLSHSAVAIQLGCPVGTIESRLSRGRQRLRIRLTQRGVASWTPAVAVLLSKGLAPMPVPRKLAGAVVRAAAGNLAGYAPADLLPGAVLSLAAGVSKAMIATRIKVALLALALLTLGALGITVGNSLVANETPRYVALATQKQATPKRPSPDLVLTGRTIYDPDKLVKIRPRFDLLVEKVRVDLGQRVKKGDPLVDVSSDDLAKAKNDFQTAYVQWQRDLKLLTMLEKRSQTDVVSQELLDDSRNDENKSRLAFMTAKEKLLVFGVPEEQIDPLIKNLRDLQKPDQTRDAADKKKLTRLAPIDGIVIRRDVVPGIFYDRHDVLMVIASLDHFLVWVEVSKQDVDKVKVGQECEVRFDFLEQTLSTSLDYVSKALVDGGVLIRVKIPNPEGRFKSDMPVRLRLRPIPPAEKHPANP